MRWIALIVASLLTVMTTAAQHSPNESVEAMQKLGYLVGEWRGIASVTIGPGGPVEAAQHEVVAWAAGGTVLTIAGRGTIVENGVERVVHDAYATVWWDGDADRYRMRAHLANGLAVDAEPLVGADTLVWGFRHPQAGQVRYTVTRTADGDWHEIGERSADGKTNWMKIMDMRLTKAAIAP
jgi:hypothetical protein